MRSFVFVALAGLPVLSFACSATRQSSFGAGTGNGTGDATSGAGAGMSLDTVGVGSTSGSTGSGDCDPAMGACGPPKPCDSGLSLTDGDPMKAAKAIELCQVAATDGYGVVSAKYVRADGTTTKAGDYSGLLPKFGQNIKPVLGSSMLGLSSGNARDAKMPGACATVEPLSPDSCKATGAGKAPAGFPQDVPGCAGSKNIFDDIGLELTLKAPMNAKGYEFNFAFMTFEFSEWICTAYNDQFMALVQPAPMGAVNGNISFDKKKNPVSVNLGFFSYCDPSTKSTFAQFCKLQGGSCPNAPSPYCGDGGSFLSGTGWGKADGWSSSGNGGGATGWLKTTAPVQGGSQFTIRFAIWDSGDQALDSAVLIDGFTWKTDGTTVDTVPDPN